MRGMGLRHGMRRGIGKGRKMGPGTMRSIPQDPSISYSAAEGQQDINMKREEKLSVLKEQSKEIKNQLKAINKQISDSDMEKGNTHTVSQLFAVVDSQKCTGCRLCQRVCPKGAILLVDNVAKINIDKCIGCDRCVEECPQGAISLRKG